MKNLKMLLVFINMAISSPFAISYEINAVNSEVTSNPDKYQDFYNYFKFFGAISLSDDCETRFGNKVLFGYTGKEFFQKNKEFIDNVYTEMTNRKDVVINEKIMDFAKCNSNYDCAISNARKYTKLDALTCATLKSDIYHGVALNQTFGMGHALKIAHDQLYNEAIRKKGGSKNKTMSFESSGLKAELIVKDNKINFFENGHNFASIFQFFYDGKAKETEYNPIKSDWEKNSDYFNRLRKVFTVYKDVKNDSLLAFPIGKIKNIKYDAEKNNMQFTLGGRFSEIREYGDIDLNYVSSARQVFSLHFEKKYSQCFLDGNYHTLSNVDSSTGKLLSNNSMVYVVGYMKIPYINALLFESMGRLLMDFMPMYTIFSNEQTGNVYMVSKCESDGKEQSYLPNGLTENISKDVIEYNNKFIPIPNEW